MIFYLVPAAAGRPAMLQPTQADANREARERGLKVRAPDMEHQVPTDKTGLMAYVNELLLEAEQLRNDIAIEVGATPILTDDEIRNSNTPEAQEAARVRMDPDYADSEASRYANGLHPKYESPFSARACLADMDVNAMLKVIRQIDGKRLGDVMAAGIARMEALRQELVL